MFDQAVVRTGIRYGVICAVFGFTVILILYFTGLNPYGQSSLFSLVFLPVFIIAGSSSYKKYNDQNLGFLKAFRVALTITFFAALASAMLTYIFSVFAGIEVIQRHITEMRMAMEAVRAQTIEMIGEANYKQTLAQLEKTTPFNLAMDDFMKKMLTGFIISIVAATFFRK
ncbi:DUF4199 domain-containing protein [Adhaeribacter aquaticus]|uniref:DUF4199 domain-containing protein n=1 Tax=Adhaeribacter aquaticus TaxID=299567 RepID=UPI0004046EC9|nr:DUF4199 domain-containing protein [Adhaeribacter aquaticus]